MYLLSVSLGANSFCKKNMDFGVQYYFLNIFVILIIMFLEEDR